MDRPGDKSNFTDEQLAEWHQLTVRCERLNALLLDEQCKTALLASDLDNVRAAHQSERDDWRADFDRLAAELREVADAGLAARNKLVFLTEHLPNILADWLGALSPFADGALEPAFAEMRRHARAILQQLGAESF